MNVLGFRMLRMRTDQFAVIPESWKGEEMDAKLNFGYTATQLEQERHIMVTTVFSFQHDSIFLKLELSCFYEFSEAGWKELKLSKAGKRILPVNLFAHLLMLTIGSARGVLHARTEGSVFNKYLIPAINVAELIKADIEMV